MPVQTYVTHTPELFYTKDQELRTPFLQTISLVYARTIIAMLGVDIVTKLGLQLYYTWQPCQQRWGNLIRRSTPAMEKQLPPHLEKGKTQL